MSLVFLFISLILLTLAAFLPSPERLQFGWLGLAFLVLSKLWPLVLR